MNSPPSDENWVWLRRSMMEAPAWRALSGNARKVVDRIMVEHLHHGGTENGNLIVTYDDFEGYALRRKSIARAIREAEALGFIDVTDRGRRSYGSARRPGRFGLTWLPRSDGTPASNRWKAIDGVAKAKSALLRAKTVRTRAPALAPDHGNHVSEADLPTGNIDSSGENAPEGKRLKATKT